MTGLTASTIDMLAACLPALGATELGRGPGDELDVALPVTLSDGRCPVYRLRVSVAGASASATEVMPTLLPAFCPERHINADGSFCLYWRAVDDIVIDGLDSALAWWETLARLEDAAALHRGRVDRAQTQVETARSRRTSALAGDRAAERALVARLRA